MQYSREYSAKGWCSSGCGAQLHAAIPVFDFVEEPGVALQHTIVRGALHEHVVVLKRAGANMGAHTVRRTCDSAGAIEPVVSNENMMSMDGEGRGGVVMVAPRVCSTLLVSPSIIPVCCDRECHSFLPRSFCGVVQPGSVCAAPQTGAPSNESNAAAPQLVGNGLSAQILIVRSGYADVNKK